MSAIDMLEHQDICTLGWSDFCRKKLNTGHVVPNCYRTPIPKCRFEMLLLTWHRASENCDCYPKIKTKKLKPFWILCQEEMLSLKNKEKLRKNLIYPLPKSKTICPDLGAGPAVMQWYNAESPKQGSIRFNSIIKTIHFAHLGIMFIYATGSA